jgi:hypothetical protein
MSEEQKSSAGAHSGAALRKGILYGLLVIMLVALGYDYLVARPAVDEAYDKIVKENQRMNARPGEVLTNTGVAELIGKEPSETFNDGADLVEVYAFRGGLPMKPHKLFAVYKRQGEQQAFYRHAKFVYESSSAVAPVSVSKTVDAGLSDEELAANAEEEMAAAGGGFSDDNGGGGGGGGRPGGGPGGGFDPAAMFDENDADGDGKLAGDEIPERMSENVAAIDTDGDAAVSKQEWTAYIETRRAQRAAAGGPGGEQPSPPPERERPPLEE